MTTKITSLNRNLDRRQFLKMASIAAAAPVALAAMGWRPAAAAPQADTTGVAPDASRQFRGVVEEVQAAMSTANIPGVSLGVYANGREEFAYLGNAHIAGGAAVTASTRFQMGSVAKTFTATAVMRLVEEGKLDLHAPVRSYLPELRLADEETARKITTWHLLNHTSGIWGDYGGQVGDGDDNLDRAIAELLPTLPVMFPLGQHMSYSNAAVAVAGRVIEVVTGEPFRAAMQRLVLDPVGLGDTTYDPSAVKAGAFARGYGKYADGRLDEVEPLFMPRVVDAPGGLWSTAGDLLKYGEFHLGIGPAADNGAVISRRTQRAMQTGQVEITGMKGIMEGHIGHSWFVYKQGGLHVVEHGGSTAAHQAGLRLIPARNVAIAVLTNAQAGEAAVQAANEAVARYYLGAEGSQLSGLDFSPKEKAPQQLADYAGIYAVPSEEYELRVVNGQLVGRKRVIHLPGDFTASNDVEDDSPQPLTFIRDDAAIVGSPEAPSGLVVFVRRTDGSVGWMAQGVRMLPRKG